MGYGLLILLLVLALLLILRFRLFSASLSHQDVKEFDFETLRLPDGMEVNFKSQGDPSKRPMLLVHGGGDSLSVWDAWIAQFNGDFHFISVDLPGHGLTSAYDEGPYSTQRFAVFVAAFVEAMKLKDFIIVGHSFGGKTVLRYVLANPEAPAAMILSSPGGYSDEQCLRMPGAVASFAQSALGRRLLRTFGNRALFTRFQYAKFFHDKTPISQAAIERQFKLFRLDKNRGVLVSLVSYEALHDEDLTGLDGIICPALFLLGRDDQIVSVSAGLRLAGDTPGSSHVVFDRMGHMSHIEITEQNAGEARAFLSKHEIR